MCKSVFSAREGKKHGNSVGGGGAGLEGWGGGILGADLYIYLGSAQTYLYFQLTQACPFMKLKTQNKL